MRLRIRFKFIAILVIASLIPVGISLVMLNWFGENEFRDVQGRVCEASAQQLAQAIDQALLHETRLIQEAVQLSGIAELAESENQDGSRPLEEAEITRIRDVDTRWQTLSKDDPILTTILNHPIAARLKSFQGRNAIVSEIFFSDNRGRLIAATNKTSDYWQADETWWQQAMAKSPNEVYLEGMQFDQSSETYSIDIAMPVFSKQNPAERIGVVKAILNIRPLFQNLPQSTTTPLTSIEIVLASGEIISRIGQPGVAPLVEHVPIWFARQFTNRVNGWFADDLPGEGRVVLGYARIGLASTGGESILLESLSPMWAIAYRNEAQAMLPVRDRMRWLSLLGIGLGISFIIVGYYIASQKIIDPLNRLRLAAKAISETVESREKKESPTKSSGESHRLLDEVGSIRTGDEIEDLATDFRFMSQRILNYQEKLEQEIAEKTQAIRRDLDFARQFQVNLMPRQYPEVTSTRDHPNLELRFHHIYRPATTVGGDFFNVLRLGDHKAGIFIADVMGHGARSALVTAIIAAILQDLDSTTQDPAEALTLLNEHFYKVVHNTGDLVFVSAFFLILDLENLTATYASAGHPSPLVLNQLSGEITELTPHLKDNPALGLFENSRYQKFQRAIQKNEVFLMFTDGLFEITDSEGLEFGRERLQSVLESHAAQPLPRLTETLVHTALNFAGEAGAADDICLVAVELAQS